MMTDTKTKTEDKTPLHTQSGKVDTAGKQNTDDHRDNMKKGQYLTWVSVV